jgi:pimeloyl-ACP methyl ester carboxylesterase
VPSFEHHGAHVYYEEFGRGFPILTFAPAGLASVIDVWSQPMAPINPTTEFAGKYRVIAMDQRNAGGRSRAPITAQDSWDSFTADHIALLDHLRIERCHLYGQCIGGSFILNLLKAQPERVTSAVLAQPIGRGSRHGPNRSRIIRRRHRRYWMHSIRIYTETALSTARTATLRRRCGHRLSCWRATTRRILTPLPRSSRSCCRTANLSRNGRLERR